MVRMPAHTHLCAQTSAHARMHAHACSCLRAHTRLRTCMLMLCVCVHVYACLCASKHLWRCAGVHTSMRMCNLQSMPSHVRAHRWHTWKRRRHGISADSHVCTHAYTHACTHSYTHAYARACTQVPDHEALQACRPRQRPPPRLVPARARARVAHGWLQRFGALPHLVSR